MNNKFEKSYKTIGEVAQLLNLINTKKTKNKSYVIRYWETKFKQIKPKIVNKRRYYDNKNVELIKKIHYLLKKQGMTIDGVKNFLNNDNLEVDEKKNKIIKSIDIKYRLNKLSKMIKNLKK